MLNIINKASGFFAVLLVVGLFLLSFSLLLGVSIGIGWILIQFLPFDLFQASLLSLIATVIVANGWYNILNSLPRVDVDEWDEDEDELLDTAIVKFEEIPSQRFYKNAAEQTWEAWFRYEVSNGIYLEFLESPRPISSMGPKQVQELAIRLADLAVQIFKRKPSHTKRFLVTVSALKQELSKMGQHPYDEDILKLATTAINDELAYDEDLQEIIRGKLWSQPTDMFQGE